MINAVDIAFIIAAIAVLLELLRSRLSNHLVYSSILLGLLWQTISYGWPGFLNTCLGVMVSFVFMYPGFVMRLFESGDVKMAMAIGAWVGPFSITNILMICFVLYAIMFAAISLRGRISGSREKSEAQSSGALDDASQPPSAPRSARKLIPFSMILLLGMFACFFLDIAVF
jgi:prepilin peptidase CpaA